MDMVMLIYYMHEIYENLLCFYGWCDIFRNLALATSKICKFMCLDKIENTVSLMIIKLLERCF